MVNKTKFVFPQIVMLFLIDDIVDVIVKVRFACDEVGVIRGLPSEFIDLFEVGLRIPTWGISMM